MSGGEADRAAPHARESAVLQEGLKRGARNTTAGGSARSAAVRPAGASSRRERVLTIRSSRRGHLGTGKERGRPRLKDCAVDEGRKDGCVVGRDGVARSDENIYTVVAEG